MSAVMTVEELALDGLRAIWVTCCNHYERDYFTRPDTLILPLHMWAMVYNARRALASFMAGTARPGDRPLPALEDILGVSAIRCAAVVEPVAACDPAAFVPKGLL